MNSEPFIIIIIIIIIIYEKQTYVYFMNSELNG